MAYYEDIDLFVTSDRNHADVINEPLEKIIENIKDTRRLIKDATDYLDTLEKTFADYTKTEDLNELLSKGIKGDKGEDGIDGIDGKNLEFIWDEYELGVRQEGETDYQFTYLRGEKGEAGDVSLEQLEQAIQEAKTDLENEIANIPKVTKTSELTNDSGFITANDIPEVDLEPYALKTQIPTTLPANGGNANTVNNQSFTWEFGNGNPTHIWGRANGEETNKVFSPSQITVGTANKLSNPLTLQVAGYLAGSFNGSEAMTIDIPVATTSTFGVMSAEQVSKLDGKIDKTAIVTSVSNASTDEEIPSAKAVYTAIQNVSVGVPADVYSKTDVDDLLADKADFSALEQLEDALTDYPTLEYLEEVKTDLENEIANIHIPTSLPASDVYDWAKQATKPTYTSAEVGALASNGTAVNASKVENALTLQIAGTTKNTFNGSSAQTFNIPNASTSTAGVMTAEQVTKLNGIATGATKNTIDTAMSSTSTNAVQNKVIYAYIQEQIQNAVKNAVKSAGDYMGKTMINVYTHQVGNPNGYTYTNNKGGFADLMFKTQDDRDNEFILIVDGVTIITSGTPSQVLKKNTDSTYELKIPFKSTFTVSYYCEASSYLHGFIYVNE